MPLSQLPRRTRLIITATVGGGVVTSALVAGLSGHLYLTTVQWTVVAVVFAVDLFSWIKPLVLFRSNQSEAFHFDEGFLVVLALLVPPAMTLAVFASVVVLSQAIRRRPFVKSVFNFGEVMLSASVALAVQRSISIPVQPLHVEAVLAACAGAAVYFVVSTSLVTALMVSMGVA